MVFAVKYPRGNIVQQISISEDTFGKFQDMLRKISEK